MYLLLNTSVKTPKDLNEKTMNKIQKKEKNYLNNIVVNHLSLAFVVNVNVLLCSLLGSCLYFLFTFCFFFLPFLATKLLFFTKDFFNFLLVCSRIKKGTFTLFDQKRRDFYNMLQIYSW